MLKTLGRAKGLHTVAFLGIGVLGAHWFWAEAARLRPANSRLVLDMTAPAGDQPAWTGQVYINSWKDKPFEFEVKPGTRRQYEFPITASPVTFLRLDPAQIRGVEVAIHSLVVESHGELIRRFTPQELAQWPRHVPDGGRVEDGAFYLSSVKAVNHIAWWSGSIDVPGVGPPDWRRAIPKEWNFRLLLLLAFGVAGAISLGILDRPGRVHLLVFITTISGVLAGVSFVSASFRGRPFATSLAVGFPTYAGYPKTQDTMMIAPLLLVPLAAALTAWKIGPRWKDTLHYVSCREAQAVSRRWFGHGLVIVLIILALLVFSVWGAAYMATASPRMFSYYSGWDSGNVVLWGYLFQNGFTPYRDFFFPYGARIFTYGAFPTGFLYWHLYSAVVLLLTLLSLYLITNRSLTRTLLIFGLWFGLCAQNVFLLIRYAVVVPIILSYICVSHAPRRIGPAHYVFWAAFALGLLDDMMMTAYGGMCIAVILFLEAANDRTAFFHDFGRRLRRDFLVPLCSVLCLGAVLARNGQLEGVLNFLLRDARGMTVYAAGPSALNDWLRLKPIDLGFFLWSGPILLSAGLYFYLTGPQERRAISAGILTLGACTLIWSYKPLVHPDSAYGWLPAPTAGFLLLLLGGSATLNRAQRSFQFVAGGLLLGSFWSSGALADIRVRTVPGAAALKADIGALWRSREQRARDVEQTWDWKNFEDQHELMHVLAAIQPRLAKGNRTSLFALSDDQVLYVLACQVPPYYFTLYDGAPLHAQQRTVEWLREKRPSVVVYDLDKLDVMGVPGPIRAPLVFEQVILNYVSDLRVGAYAILRPRKPEEPVDLAFWQEALGPANLGHLPRFSSFSRFQPCADASGGTCSEFLTVSLESPLASPGELSIPVAVGGRRFAIAFATVPEQREYAVFLDRVWFWGPLRRAGLSPTLAGAVAGANVEIVRRAPRHDILW